MKLEDLKLSVLMPQSHGTHSQEKLNYNVLELLSKALAEYDPDPWEASLYNDVSDNIAELLEAASDERH